MAVDQSLTTLKDLTKTRSIHDFREFNKDLEVWNLYLKRVKSEEANGVTIDYETNDMFQKMYHVIKETKLLAETLSVHLDHFQPQMRATGARQKKSISEEHSFDEGTQSADSGIMSIPSESFLRSEIGRSSCSDYEAPDKPVQETQESQFRIQPVEHKEDSDSQEENDSSSKS